MAYIVDDMDTDGSIIQHDEAYWKRLFASPEYQHYIAQEQSWEKRKDMLLNRWNAIGQYVKVNGFCFPFSIENGASSIVTWDLYPYRNRPLYRVVMGDFSYRAGQDYGFQEMRYVYRLQDAADDDVWLNEEDMKKVLKGK